MAYLSIKRESRKMINLNEISVNHFKSPIGSYGFRRGDWSVTYKNKEHKVYCSVPHGLDLEDQALQVKQAFVHMINKEEGKGAK